MLGVSRESELERERERERETEERESEREIKIEGGQRKKNSVEVKLSVENGILQILAMPHVKKVI